MPSGAKKRKAAKRKKETAAVSVDAPFGSHDQACLGRDEDDFISPGEKDRGNGNPLLHSLLAQQLSQNEIDFPVEKDASLVVCVERVESLGEEATGGTTSGTDSEDHALYVDFYIDRVSELGSTPILKSDANMMTQALVPQQTRDLENESTMNSLLKTDDYCGVPSAEKVNHTEVISWPVNHEGSDNQVLGDQNESTNPLLKIDDYCGFPSAEKVNHTEGITWPVNHEGLDNQKLLIPISVCKTSWKSCCGLFELISGFKK